MWFPQYAVEVGSIPVTKATTTSGSPKILLRINPIPPTTHTGQTILPLPIFNFYLELIELDADSISKDITDLHSTTKKFERM
jgi:hypothetical protein